MGRTHCGHMKFISVSAVGRFFKFFVLCCDDEHGRKKKLTLRSLRKIFIGKMCGAGAIQLNRSICTHIHSKEIGPRSHSAGHVNRSINVPTAANNIVAGDSIYIAHTMSSKPIHCTHICFQMRRMRRPTKCERKQKSAYRIAVLNCCHRIRFVFSSVFFYLRFVFAWFFSFVRSARSWLFADDI